MAKLVTAQLLEEVLTAKCLSALHPNDRFHIELALVKHILGLTNYVGYNKDIGKRLKIPERKELRKQALDNFAIVVRLKHSLLQILTRRLTDPQDMQDVFDRFNLEDHTTLLDGLRMQRIYGKAVQHAQSALLHFESEEAVRHKCQEVLKQTKIYAKWYVRVNLDFVHRYTEGVSKDDLVNDLQTKAVQVFYETIPLVGKQSKGTIENVDLYLLNFIRRSQHNYGIHRIKYYTADCRKSLSEQDENGRHTLTNEALFVEQGNDNNGVGQQDVDGREENSSINHNSDQHEVLSKLETKMTYRDLMATHGRQPRKRMVLQLLSMVEDKSFTERALSMYPKVVSRKDDTQELFNRLGRERFLEAVRIHAEADKIDFYDFIRIVERIF